MNDFDHPAADYKNDPLELLRARAFLRPFNSQSEFSTPSRASIKLLPGKQTPALTVVHSPPSFE
jgi:hypothetical protein